MPGPRVTGGTSGLAVRPTGYKVANRLAAGSEEELAHARQPGIDGKTCAAAERACLARRLAGARPDRRYAAPRHAGLFAAGGVLAALRVQVEQGDLREEQRQLL